MLVSIVTVYYNRENQVKESIESLLNQTYQNIEIIAVDDGSTDNTYKLLSSYKDSRLKVIRHTNSGFVKSIRKAIEHSNGDIIAVHGSGDISFLNRIEKQVSVLKNNSRIGVVSCYC
ncbi:MAG: glycosyltransferase family 2 protein [Alkalibacterium sp.]|nr:glycosyltransferase family 2 protein [Alkalibacterium sp.]